MTTQRKNKALIKLNKTVKLLDAHCTVLKWRNSNFPFFHISLDRKSCDSSYDPVLVFVDLQHYLYCQLKARSEFLNPQMSAPAGNHGSYIHRLDQIFVLKIITTTIPCRCVSLLRLNKQIPGQKPELNQLIISVV